MTGKDVKRSRRQIIEWIVLALELGFMLAGVITGRNELMMMGWLLFAAYFVLMSFRLIDEKYELAKEDFRKSMKLFAVKCWIEDTRMNIDDMSREEVKESLDAAIKMLDK